MNIFLLNEKVYFPYITFLSLIFIQNIIQKIQIFNQVGYNSDTISRSKFW